MTTAWLLWRPQQSLRTYLDDCVAAGVAAFAVPALLMSESVLVAAGLIAGIGATSGLITPLVSASLQERTPKDLMARVFGPFNTGTMVFSMIGMTLFGWLADSFGPERQPDHDRRGERRRSHRVVRAASGSAAPRQGDVRAIDAILRRAS